jgi:hypothetical protein
MSKISRWSKLSGQSEIFRAEDIWYIHISYIKHVHMVLFAFLFMRTDPKTLLISCFLDTHTHTHTHTHTYTHTNADTHKEVKIYKELLLTSSEAESDPDSST